MALQNFQYDIIMREYSRRQSQVQHDLEERRKEAFIRVPRLLEIDQEVAALSARKARSLLLGESDTVEDLKKDVAALAQERRTLLRSNGFFETGTFLSVNIASILTEWTEMFLFQKIRGRITVHTVKSERDSQKREL